MLSIDTYPTFLDEFTLVAFRTRQRLGEPGRLELTVQAGEPGRSELELYLVLQAGIGARIHCTANGWLFDGTVEWVESTGNAGEFRVEAGDALSALDRRLRSRVFADRDLGGIVADVLGDIPHRIDEAMARTRLRLANQYQESDWSFLRRVVRECGGRIRCIGKEVHVFDGAPPPSVDLVLGSDILGCRLAGGLGPERVNGVAIAYRDDNRRTAAATGLPADGAGRVRAAAIRARRAGGGAATLHQTAEDDRHHEMERRSIGFLRASASDRFVLEGRVRGPLAPGTGIKVCSDDGREEETLLVTGLTGWRSAGTPSTEWRIEARCPDAMPSAAPAAVFGPNLSTAVVGDVDDPENLNRARVRFPWDERGTLTPWIRIVTPSWGDGHFHCTAPKPGDTVVVLWGQWDTDPVILGCVSSGHAGPATGGLLTIRTREGHTIAIGAESIVLRNESGGEAAEMECGQGRIRLRAGNGNEMRIAADGIVLGHSSGARMTLDRSGVSVESPGGVDIRNRSGASVELAGPRVAVNGDALEVV